MSNVSHHSRREHLDKKKSFELIELMYLIRAREVVPGRSNTVSEFTSVSRDKENILLVGDTVTDIYS